MSRIKCTLYLIVCLLLSSCINAGKSIKKAQDYAWVLATASPENTVTGIFATTFADKVNELSGGTMQIKVYHNSVLGGDTELFESCQAGDIPFVVQNTAPEVSYLPQLCLFDLPCVFSTLDQLHQVLDQPEFMQQINRIYQSGGFRLLGMADQHFRVMTSNKEIKEMSDLKGIKIRTMENSYHMAFWSKFGTNPTPMAFAELYVGLEQHMVDAQENPYEVICSNGFYEVQKYVIETNHLPHLLALITNDSFYNELPKDQQKIIDTAASYARDYARQQAIERSNSRIEEIRSHDTQVVQISEELRQDLRQAAAPVFEQIRHVVNNDALYNTYCK